MVAVGESAGRWVGRRGPGSPGRSKFLIVFKVRKSGLEYIWSQEIIPLGGQ